MMCNESAPLRAICHNDSVIPSFFRVGALASELIVVVLPAHVHIGEHCVRALFQVGWPMGGVRFRCTERNALARLLLSPLPVRSLSRCLSTAEIYRPGQ